MRYSELLEPSSKNSLKNHPFRNSPWSFFPRHEFAHLCLKSLFIFISHLLYARIGACEVIEQSNLSSHMLNERLLKIIQNQDLKNTMIKNTQNFSHPDAARRIAQSILDLGSHK